MDRHTVITMEIEEINDYKRIEGYVNNCIVIVVSTSVDAGRWTVDSSSCLPTDVALANDYVRCMSLVMGKMMEMQKQEAIYSALERSIKSQSVTSIGD